MLDIIRHIERHWNTGLPGALTVIEDYPDRLQLQGFDSPEPTDANNYKSYLTIEEVKQRIEFLQQVLKDIAQHSFWDADEGAFGKEPRFDYD